MLLRSTPERQEAELKYVRDMNLNAIRFEGKLEDDHFLDLADQYGILVLAGWCCCDHWEQWPKWEPEDEAIAAASLRDQLRRSAAPSGGVRLAVRQRQSAAAEDRARYTSTSSRRWSGPNPYAPPPPRRRRARGRHGRQDERPDDWVAPTYWLADDHARRRARLQDRDQSGAAVPPIESLRRCSCPPITSGRSTHVWNYHAGGGQFRTIHVFTDALNARYGAADRSTTTRARRS